MTSNNEWVRERVRSLQTYHGGTLVHIQDVRDFGRECIERGKDGISRERALQMADEIIAAEARGRQSILDRLRNPDEALVEAVVDGVAKDNTCPLPAKNCLDGRQCVCLRDVMSTFRALARALTEGEEKSDG